MVQIVCVCGSMVQWLTSIIVVILFLSLSFPPSLSLSHTHTACDCNAEGSLSLQCNQTNGLCPCLPSVQGEKCDRCQDNSTDFFPSCEGCGECTGQWQSRINPLRKDIETTLELIGVKIANVDPEDIPLISMLLGILREVQDILSSSQIDPKLATNMTELHRRLCELTNQTQDLFDRALAVSNEIARLDSEVEIFENETFRLANLIMELRDELNQLTQEFGNITVPSPNYNVYLELARRAEERSDHAHRLISENVTNLISLTEGILAEYNRKLIESDFLARQTENMRRLSFFNQRVIEYEAFLVEVSTKLCGSLINSSDVCGECGGVHCEMCGGPGCNGLIATANDSLNISVQALMEGQSIRLQILSQVSDLRAFLAEVLAQKNETLEAENATRAVKLRADELWQQVQDLLEVLRRQLEENRIDLDDIEEVENNTLSLRLNTTQEEVCFYRGGA